MGRSSLRGRRRRGWARHRPRPRLSRRRGRKRQLVLLPHLTRYESLLPAAISAGRFPPMRIGHFHQLDFRAHSGIRPVVIYMTEWSGHNWSENCPIIPWPPEQNAKGGGSVQPKKLCKLRGMGARIRTVPDLIPRHSFCVTQRAAWKTGGKPPLKVRAKRRGWGRPCACFVQRIGRGQSADARASAARSATPFAGCAASGSLSPSATGALTATKPASAPTDSAAKSPAAKKTTVKPVTPQRRIP